MSSHRQTIEMLEEKITDLQRQWVDAGIIVEKAKTGIQKAENELRRAEQDRELVNHELKGLEHTLDVLKHDANVEHVQVYPS